MLRFYQFLVQTTLMVAAVIAGLAAVTANAATLPGVLKFSQLPLNGVTINGTAYYGHDEASYATLNANDVYVGKGAADDFSDYYNTPVIGVQWWGSYIPTPVVGGPLITPVPDFLISFESDVPVSPTGGFSHPGSVLLAQTVTRNTGGPLAPGQFTEAAVGPTNNLFVYQALLQNPFPEAAGTVYWLKIAGLFSSTSEQWGWHNRDYTTADPLANPGETNINAAGTFPVWHFGDDAVQGFLNYTPPTSASPGSVDEGDFVPLTYNPNNTSTDGPAVVTGLSEDLAFQLYTTPEPAPLVLLAIGGMALLLVSRRNIPGTKHPV
jgi:hypothetical protein